MATTAIHFESCTDVSVDGCQFEGFDYGVTGRNVSGFSGRDLKFRNVANPVAFASSHGIELSGISAEMPDELARLICERIASGTSLGDIQESFGDRLKTYHIDLDVWMARLGNAASVLGLLFALFSQHR